MISSFFSLNRRDLINGVIVAALGALLGALQQGLTAHGMDFGAYDWALIIDVSITAGFSYLSKNLFTTKEGKFAGIL